MRLRRWLMTGPVAARLITPLLTAPFAVAAEEAMRVPGGHLSWIAIAVAMSAVAVRKIRAEPPNQRIREKIFDGVRRGLPTGEPEIDYVIEDHLTLAAREGRTTTIVGTLLIVAILAAPIVAGIRVSAWWLATYAVLPVLVLAIPTESFTDPAQARLARFRLAASEPAGSAGFDALAVADAGEEIQ